MQWIPDKLGTFQKIRLSLKNNGRFMMIVPLPHAHLPNIRNELIQSSRWRKYFVDYSDPLIYINDSDYRTFAEKSELIISLYSIDPTPIKFSSYDNFFHFMYQMTPHINCIPEENNKNEFVHDVVEKYLQIYPQAKDGSCQLDFTLVKFCAYREY